ncbi:hypothetical protein [Brackiella oedipodis]|uniref:hypothetical protein n=1 Tax=Brackiella oedipodis TaxID=124225 RepID=UPI000491E55D|nr:hypothetical protein [Brackiella oedipodis]
MRHFALRSCLRRALRIVLPLSLLAVGLAGCADATPISRQIDGMIGTVGGSFGQVTGHSW